MLQGLTLKLDLGTLQHLDLVLVLDPWSHRIIRTGQIPIIGPGESEKKGTPLDFCEWHWKRQEVFSPPPPPTPPWTPLSLITSDSAAQLETGGIGAMGKGKELPPPTFACPPPPTQLGVCPTEWPSMGEAPSQMLHL